MRFHALERAAPGQLQQIIDEGSDSILVIASVHQRIETLIASIEKEKPDFVIIECESSAAAIAEVRSNNDTVPIVATGDDIDASAARAAGADAVLPFARLDAALLEKAARFAIDRRDAARAEDHLLASLREIDEAFNGEENLEEAVQRILERVVERTKAEAGYLVCEWEWSGELNRVDAISGARTSSAERTSLSKLRALAEHPDFSPLLLPPGRSSVPPEKLASLGLGPIATLMVVPIGHEPGWGRGGIVLTHSQKDAFTERQLRVATGLAVSTGVAIRQAGIVRERNRAIEVRERVLAVASHDLRNPLSVFNMALELLAECEDASERRDITQRAQRSIATMRRLISDLLDYAALDAGKLRIEKQGASPWRIATRALEGVEHLATKKSIEIRRLPDAEAPLEPIAVDAGRIEQALTNLLTNAVKFTPRDGVVGISVTQNAEHTIFVVSDTGPGIPEERQRLLFDRYYTSTQSGKGIGLGLSIARGIAESHGGTLLVESTLGDGSRFMLTVPNKAPP